MNSSGSTPGELDPAALAQPLWTFLIATSGVRDEAERARLTATALPALLRCTLSGVALLEVSGGRWKLFLQAGGHQESAERAEAHLSELEPLFEQVLDGPGLLTLSVDDPGGPISVPKPLERAGVHRLAVAPLITVSARLGVIFAGRGQADPFSREDCMALSMIAEHLAVAVENLRLYATLQRYSEQLEQRNELILSSAGEGIYGLDENGRITFANPATERLLGWTLDEVMGQPAHAQHHHTRPDGTPYPAEECPVYAAFRDGRVHRVDDEVFWRKDGTSVPVEYTSTPIREHGVLAGAVVVFRDITERKLAEEKLHRALAEVEALKNQLEAENVYLKEEIKTQSDFESIIGESPAMKATLSAVETVAPTDANVLIVGETGTGKELIARAVHALSSRKDKPLIKVNCASVPKELFESEFFGHVKGAFTGAVRNRAGRFQLADRGTLFLDEVGEIPLDLQSKLLRVLQEGEFERIGEEKTTKVDVRIIAATNRDLKHEVAEGRFREDLYYRLSVFPIPVSPLRGRRQDIPLLAEYCLRQAARRLNRPGLTLSIEALEKLSRYDWPGNVRELQNVLERAVIVSRGPKVSIDLPSDAPNEAYAGAVDLDDESAVATEAEIRRLERENIERALQASGWRIHGAGGAAELLDMKPTTLASRVKKLGLKKPG